MNHTVEQARDNLIATAKKGYPILLGGAIVWLLMALIPFVFAKEIVHLIWIWGLMAIFPLGLMLGHVLKIDLFVKNNPLSELGAFTAAPQAFFIPVFIVVYMKIPEYLPFTIGLLGASHFLPYAWIYKSKAYLIMAIGMGLSSFIIGGYFIEYAFTFVPLAISLFFMAAIVKVMQELKKGISPGVSA
ncbi:DUF7010 family protein [Cytobacillus firmus]|uniref:DUF7010 family protein n=1 Tax=Cytobacillus firmus TaxID=1399 RepID=UPI00157FBFA8|nr:hypothetical protein [Cytobacillus firmus]MBG9546197.1 hypothetical protein [Cytobacillus firmus]MBG9601270.1 hypothetical protein [Cytobacillus firmus]MBG9658005.1 hypothetical protein [Cytobacillus firmus]MDD9309866.1 hypothetical protein [Cytobacillus firmus]MED1907922.1 hypothetical protein [Cytobacillus firmus]